MQVDPKFIALSKPSNQQVFKEVAKRRQVNLKDLLVSLPTKMTREVVSESLNELEQVGLIKEESASLEDFKTLYVTAEGLQAERQLRRLEAASA